MRAITKWFTQSVLIISGLILISGSVFFYKSTAAIGDRVKKAEKTGAPVRQEVSQNDLLAAKKVIEAGAYMYDLPVDVSIKDNKIHISSRESVVTDSLHYSSLLRFFSYISALPYGIEYENVCLGVSCPGRDVKIELKIVGR